MRDQLLQFRASHPAKTIQLDGAEWSYHLLGRGNECIVFLHGGMGDGESYFEYLPALEGDSRLLAPTIPATIYTVSGVVNGIAGILDAESIGSVHLFGHSQGGFLAPSCHGRQGETGVRCPV